MDAVKHVCVMSDGLAAAKALIASKPAGSTLVDHIAGQEWAAWDASGEKSLACDKDGLS